MDGVGLMLVLQDLLINLMLANGTKSTTMVFLKLEISLKLPVSVKDIGFTTKQLKEIMIVIMTNSTKDQILPIALFRLQNKATAQRKSLSQQTGKRRLQKCMMGKAA